VDRDTAPAQLGEGKNAAARPGRMLGENLASD